MKIVTLTTDFGVSDWFVGTIKGVILKTAPDAKIVDITHDIPPQNISAGAFAIMSSYKYFPDGTIHLVVVDPEVGGKRNPIVVKTRNFWFVGPDNGLLSYALKNEKVIEIRLIENQELCLTKMGTTFHGRDIFAPITAHIANGINPELIGRSINSYVQLKFPDCARNERLVTGEVVYIDKFGNAITNIDFKNTTEFFNWRLLIRNKIAATVLNCYADVEIGKPVVVYGSSGFLEIAVRNGNAAKKLKLKTGTKLSLVKDG